jgi:transposase
VTSDNTLMPLSFTRSLRLKVRAEAHVSSLKLAKTRMAKSVLDSGWGMLKNFLDYESQQAARTIEVVNERYTSIICSPCGAVSGPRGVNGLTVRAWICRNCGESHDRDPSAARNILIGSRCRTSVRGNELSSWLIPPSNAYRVREAQLESAWTTA